MKDVAILLRDAQYENEILSFFSQQKCLAHIYHSKMDLLEYCQRELVDLILIWPAIPDETEDVLTLLHINSLEYIPVVLVIDKNAEMAHFLKYPVADVVKMPLPRVEFAAILNRIFTEMESDIKLLEESRWSGSLEEIGLTEILRMLESQKKDAILSISYLGQLGQIFLKNGTVVKAVLRDLDSKTALLKLNSLQKGQFEIQFVETEEPEEPIQSARSLLLDLIEYNARLDSELKTIGEPFQEVIWNDLEGNPEYQSEIPRLIEFTLNGVPLHDLLFTLTVDNLEALQVIKQLVNDKLLLKRQDYNVLQRQIEQGKGLSGLLLKVKSLFRRSAETPETEFEEVREMDTPEKEPAGLEIQKLNLSKNDKSILKDFVERILQ
ncbi:MAG: hypothetical protein Kow0037_03300 [Calditrichia bacterium]